jgi:hypothetical protein
MTSTSLIPAPTYRYGESVWDDHLRSIQCAIVDLGRTQTGVVRESTSAIAAGLEELRGDLNWGFTLLHDQLDTHRRQFEEISERLRAIEETLKAPTLTRARESFTLGRQQIRQGLLVKGLEQFAKAERLISCFISRLEKYS